MDNLTKVLETVRVFTRENPQFCSRVIQAANAGVEQALVQAEERAADMEAGLMLALTAKPVRTRQGQALAKVRKWRGRTTLKWDFLL